MATVVDMKALFEAGVHLDTKQVIGTPKCPSISTVKDKMVTLLI